MVPENSIVRAEQQILKYCTINPDSLSVLSVEDFISDIGKTFLSAMKNIVESGASLDIDTLYTEATRLDTSLKEDAVLLLFDEVITENNFNYYRKVLREEKAGFDIQEHILQDIIKEVSKPESINYDVIRELRDTLDAKLEIIRGENQYLHSVSNTFEVYSKDIARREDGKFFYSSGCHHLDNLFMTGFEPGYFSVLFSHSGAGKSSYGTYLLNRWINLRMPCLAVWNEMTLISNVDRIIALRHNIPLDMMYPKGNDSDVTFLKEIVEKEKKILEGYPFKNIDKPNCSLSDLRYGIKETKRDLHANYLIVLIDLLTKVKDFNGDNKASTYEDAANNLDELCKSENVHVIGIVQSRRPSTKVDAKTIDDLEKFRPRIEEIKNSSALEERARIVMSLYRKKFYAERIFKNAEDPSLRVAVEAMQDIIEIDVLKQNLGQIGGRARYVFNAPICSFFPYVEEEIY